MSHTVVSESVILCFNATLEKDIDNIMEFPIIEAREPAWRYCIFARNINWTKPRKTTSSIYFSNVHYAFQEGAFQALQRCTNSRITLHSSSSVGAYRTINRIDMIRCKLPAPVVVFSNEWRYSCCFRRTRVSRSLSPNCRAEQNCLDLWHSDFFLRHFLVKIYIIRFVKFSVFFSRLRPLSLSPLT